jgi:serine/threonine-protein kinase
VGDARLELEEVLAGGDRPAARSGLARSAAWQRRAIWLIPVVAALTWLAFSTLVQTPPRQPQSVRRFLVAGNGLPRLAPDGTRMVIFSAEKLSVQDFSLSAPSVIEGTDGAYAPFFSPDGRWVGYFDRGAKTALREVALSGGSPQTIAPVSDARGGVWGQPRVGWRLPGPSMAGNSFSGTATNCSALS